MMGGVMRKPSDVMREVLKELDAESFETAPEVWDSLIVNRRKPHTYRASRMYGDWRICLHRFDHCSEKQAFRHPHPWPGGFFVLGGQRVKLQP